MCSIENLLTVHYILPAHKQRLRTGYYILSYCLSYSMKALHLLGAPLPGQRRRRGVRLPGWLACGCLAACAATDGSEAGDDSDSDSSGSHSRQPAPKDKDAAQVRKVPALPKALQFDWVWLQFGSFVSHDRLDGTKQTQKDVK